MRTTVATYLCLATILFQATLGVGGWLQCIEADGSVRIEMAHGDSPCQGCEAPFLSSQFSCYSADHDCNACDMVGPPNCCVDLPLSLDIVTRVHERNNDLMRQMLLTVSAMPCWNLSIVPQDPYHAAPLPVVSNSPNSIGILASVILLI